jgi:hypothetical protein
MLIFAYVYLMNTGENVMLTFTGKCYILEQRCVENLSLVPERVSVQK